MSYEGPLTIPIIPNKPTEDMLLVRGDNLNFVKCGRSNASSFMFSD